MLQDMMKHWTGLMKKNECATRFVWCTIHLKNFERKGQMSRGDSVLQAYYEFMKHFSVQLP